jgi:hypothetical protein
VSRPVELSFLLNQPSSEPPHKLRRHASALCSTTTTYLRERERKRESADYCIIIEKKKRKSLWNEPCEKTVWEMLWEKLREAEFEVEEDEDKERFVNLEGRFSNEHETDAISILFLIPSSFEVQFHSIQLDWIMKS